MKYIPRHSKSLEIEFSSKGFLLFRATFPIKNNQSSSIPDWFKRTKIAIATSHGVPVEQIKGSHKTVESIAFDRIVFEWPGGISLDIPDTTTSYDYKIILHYLEGLKMAVKPLTNE